MPKELTHWILATKSVERLPGTSPVRRTIEAHRELYLAGAVLPDTLLHIFRGPYHPTARTLANTFHDAPGNSYAPLIRAAERFGSDIPAPLFSCLLGVLSHIRADIGLHPFVFATTGTSDIGRHYRLETDLDVRFLRRGVVPPSCTMSHLVQGASRDTLLDALQLLFDPENELPREGHAHALDLHCRIQGMYHRTFWKMAAALLAFLAGSPFREQKHLFYPLLPLGGKDLAGDGATWHCPVSGTPQSATVDEMVEEVLGGTALLFERIDSKGSFAAALTDPPGANLLTGLHGVGLKQMTV